MKVVRRNVSRREVIEAYVEYDFARSAIEHNRCAGEGARREGGEATGVTLLREPAVEATAAIPAPVDVPPENPREVLSDSPRVDPLAMVRKAFGATVPH
jgi:hypothetical protein